MVEVTYTQLHVENNISVMDIIKYFKDEIGIDTIHIMPVMTSDNLLKLKNTDTFVDAIDEINKVTENEYTFTTVDAVIDAIKQKIISRYHCGCGINNYSVSYKGNVYICGVMTDNKDFCFGNVADEDMFIAI